jgi:signal peptidase
MSKQILSSTRRLAVFVLCASVLGTVACTLVLAWANGYRMYVVETGSMAPTINAGDVVVDRRSGSGFEQGDVVTVQISDSGQLVTHRMTHLDRQGKLHTKGDANEKADAWALKPTSVRGVVQHTVPNFGYVVVFFRQPEGIAGVMTGALSVFLLWGLCFPAQATERSRTRTELLGAEPAPA